MTLNLTYYDKNAIFVQKSAMNKAKCACNTNLCLHTAFTMSPFCAAMCRSAPPKEKFHELAVDKPAKNV